MTRDDGGHTVGLVGCVKSKRAYPSRARELYISEAFLGRRAYVERTCDEWFILSAKHGLVDPDDWLEPYDETLNGAPASRKREWARHVLQRLDELGVVDRASVFEIHAGAEYRDFGLADNLRARGAKVVVPAEHLGFGEQLAFYKRATQRAGPPTSAYQDPPPPADQMRSSEYARLVDYLGGLTVDAVEQSFADLEEILGRSLPHPLGAVGSGGGMTHPIPRLELGWLLAGLSTTSTSARNACGSSEAPHDDRRGGGRDPPAAQQRGAVRPTG